MAVLTRATDFVPNTLIQSQQIDDELNQLVNLLSGVSTNKDTLLKYNHATDPVLRVDQLGAGSVQQWLQNGIVRASLSGLGKLLLPAGIGATPSTDQISNFGTYFADPTDRATPASTAETDLSSKTTSANVLANDGDFFMVYSFVVYAANANTKRYRIYFAGSAIFDTAAQAFNGTLQIVLGFIFRETSTSLSARFIHLFPGHGAGFAVASTPLGSLNFATSNILKSTGQNGAATAADIIQGEFLLLKGSV